MGQVDGFLPSRSGLHFPNAWPDVPELVVSTPLGAINIGDAANGLCGGMAFAVRDLFENHKPPPGSSANPPRGTAAFQFIVDRLFDSFNLPHGVIKYFLLMNLPLADTAPGLHDGLPWSTIQQTLPEIRASINAGHPCPIGIIRVHSVNPFDLGKNHQVLVWGFADEGPMTTLHVYDPNHPDRDDVTITFDHTHPEQATEFHFNVGGVDSHFNCLGFFVTDYRPSDPGPLLQGRSVLQLHHEGDRP